TEVASRLSRQEEYLLSLRKQADNQRTEIKCLIEQSQFWEMWQSRYSLPILCLFCFAITVLFGACTVVVVRPALGALVCLIGVCITVLTFILVRYSEISPAERIDRINRQLENEEAKLLYLVTELQCAKESTDQTILRWKVYQARYERLCELDDLASQYEEAS